MSNYSNTKATIAANIYTNHNNEVTAEMVKAGINAVLDTLIAGGFIYKGVAHPGDPAITSDANIFVIATEAGTYTNFKNSSNVALQVADGEVAILKYNGSWSKEVTGAATSAEVSALGQEVDDLSGAIDITRDPSYNLFDLSTADLGKQLTSGATAMTIDNYKTYETANSQINTLAPITIANGKYIVISYTNNEDPNTARQTGTFKNFIVFDHNGDFLQRSFSQGTWHNTTGSEVKVVVGIYDESVPGSYYKYAMIEVNDSGTPTATYRDHSDSLSYDLSDDVASKLQISQNKDDIQTLFGNITTLSNADTATREMFQYKIEYVASRASISCTGATITFGSGYIYAYNNSGVQIAKLMSGESYTLDGTDNTLVVDWGNGSTLSVIKQPRTSLTNKQTVLAHYDSVSGIQPSALLGPFFLQDEIDSINTDLEKLLDNTGTERIYFETEMVTTASSLNTIMSAPCLVFNVITDTHLNIENADSVRRTKDSVNNISALNKLIRSDGIIHLGDLLSVSMNGQPADNLYLAMSEYITSLYKSGVDVFPVIGNHDGPAVNAFNPNRWFAIAGRLDSQYTEHPDKQINGNGVTYYPAYYYKDFHEIGVRCVFLSVPESDEQYSYAMSAKQLKWFAEVALNVSAGYQILIFAHIAPFDTDFSSKTTQYSAFLGVCNAFHNKTSYSKTDGGYNITADYSGKTGCEIAAYICGHQHFDNVAVPGWTYEGLDNNGNAHSYENEFSFPVINIGAGLFTNAVTNTFGGTTPSRTDKTATQDLWDTLVYRPDEKKVYLIRFGAGSDRTITTP